MFLGCSSLVWINIHVSGMQLISMDNVDVFGMQQN